MKGEEVLNHYTYTYDGYGNITAVEGTETTDTKEGISKLISAAMTYDADNRLLTYNGEALKYDADGNMTYGPVKGIMSELTYDCRNRLVSAGGITYTYDAENNRISAETDTYKEEYVTDTVSSSLSRVMTVTRYNKGVTTGTETLYLYGNGLISEKKGDIVLYHHYNHLGSTTKLTDSEGGVVETYTYGTYGELLSGDMSLTRFLYNGRYGVSTDDNGLYYMRQRYYNPEIKRFINQDILSGSLDNSQSLNRYCYVQGNPLSYTDPFGLSPMSSFSDIGHSILGLIGCIPGPVGMVANAADAIWYFAEGNTSMGVLSLVSLVSCGTAGIASKGIKGLSNASKVSKLTKSATYVHYGCELITNSASFLMNGSMLIENGVSIYNKYQNGEEVTGADWLNVGLNLFGTVASGAGAASNVKALKNAGIVGDLKNFYNAHKLDNRGCVDLSVFKSGKTSSGLPDWLKARFEAGNNFNKENRPRYPYNEVEVYGDGKNYVVDSYIPGSEIVSRKFTQLASVQESTGIGYLNELQKKYPSGAIITDSPFNPKVLRGKTMTGNLILEIPEQKGSIPQSVIDYANSKGIIIRDVNGKEYN
ncbi:MAG: RHS repeat-associated core domain-containing protein [Lachnospiraceae bacterium]|nr:RHS repeat-associated core domain-containing protein [Lachnospiraceae bacterium]